MRDRLIELLTDNLPRCGNLPHWDNPLQLSCDEQVERIADHLLANGIIVPPVKVGDTVWEIEYTVGSYELWEAHPLETEVKAICVLTEYDYHPISAVGKDVFLTREDAEQSLKESVCND